MGYKEMKGKLKENGREVRVKWNEYAGFYEVLDSKGNKLTHFDNLKDASAAGVVLVVPKPAPDEPATAAP